MFKYGDMVGIVVNSNPLQQNEMSSIEALIEQLTQFGLKVVVTPYLYKAATGKQRSDIMLDYYKNNQIKAIFDVSGGDLANGILEELDYTIIKQYPKPFFGYSDLTTVINALYTQVGCSSYLYQVKNLVYQNKEKQCHWFKESLFSNHSDLFCFDYRFIQGEHLSGVIIGGNIRCLLKLAGTPYFPDFTDKILFLESYGGKAELNYTHLIHLKQLGIFKQIKGLVLGTFTAMQDNHVQPTIEELVVEVVDDPYLTIVKTEEIGHSNDSKCLIIGSTIELNIR